MRKLSLFLTGALLLPGVAIAQEAPQSTPSQQDPSATSSDTTAPGHKKHKDKRRTDPTADSATPAPESGTTGSGTTEPAPTPDANSGTTPAPAPDPAAPTPQR